jgi:hypothetical protein
MKPDLFYFVILTASVKIVTAYVVVELRQMVETQVQPQKRDNTCGKPQIGPPNSKPWMFL